MTRAGLSLLAVLIGWFAAACATLPFEVWELVRNARQGQATLDLVDGCALWLGFTLLVTCGVWLVMVLAIAVLVPPRLIVRHRLPLAIGAALLGATVVGKELDLWHALVHPGPESPFASFVMQIYMTFAVIFAAAVTWTYSLLLRRSISPLLGVPDEQPYTHEVYESRR
jgi:hypothetical protein